MTFQGASLSSPKRAVVKKCQVVLLNEAYLFDLCTISFTQKSYRRKNTANNNS